MLAQQVEDEIPKSATGLRLIANDVQFENDTRVIEDILTKSHDVAKLGGYSIEYAIRFADCDKYYRILTARGFNIVHVKGTSFNDLKQMHGLNGVGVFIISWNKTYG